MNGRVLILAGSDSSGGAGIQADIKAVSALGGYAATAITALTAQNTEGVHGVMPVAPDFIDRQARVTLADIGADALKTGMLHSPAVIETVCGILDGPGRGLPVVVDPVMVAQSGAPLLQPAAVACLRELLVPRARLLTPNLPEAEALTGLAIETPEDMKHAAEAIAGLGAGAVLIKGGHGTGEIIRDLLWWRDGTFELFEEPRIASRNNHGTGCTLASAIAAGLAQGMGMRDAVARGRAYVREAIRTAPDYGRGNGPLNHTHTVAPFSG